MIKPTKTKLKKKINTRNKMNSSNQKARKWLLANNFKELYAFPHLRFQKGWNIENEEFDGICVNYDSFPHIVLYQIKSNQKIPKKTLIKYREISLKLCIRCIWINAINRKGVEIYE